MPGEITTLENASVQRNDVEQESSVSIGILGYLYHGNSILPAWWSTARDRELRSFYRGSNHLSGAIYAIVARLITIPFEIQPIDPSIAAHARKAEIIQDSLLNMTDFGRGWNFGYAKWVLDLLTQDNGAFMEVIGDGPPDGPIRGMPYGVAHLDAARVTRTASREFPVVYTDRHGKHYKMHYTRVIDCSSMPSAELEMNGVGYCATSRCSDTAQHLVDIGTYEMEKLGSRPVRGLLVGSKISASDMAASFAKADVTMTGKGQSRFSSLVFVGSPANDINIDLLNLASLPDGYDKEADTRIGMAVISLALGVDFRELWPATITGATKADASIQHLKAKGKGIGELLEFTRRSFQQKVLPPYLRMVHDFTDDEQDSLRASILLTRSQSYEKLMNAQAVTERVSREMMLSDGTIDDGQFLHMELSSGRLYDGAPLLSLFYSKDQETAAMLDINVSDPAQVTPSAELTASIDRRLAAIGLIYQNTSSTRLKMKSEAAIAALVALRKVSDPTGANPVWMVEEAKNQAVMVEEVKNGEADPVENEGDITET
jgi:hypothetical protein